MKSSILFLFSWVLFVESLCAAEVGTLYLEGGQIQVTRSHKAQVYGPGPQLIRLQEKDRIRTGPNATGKIVFAETHNEIRLFEDAFLNLDFIGSQRVELNLKIGKAKFKVKKRKRRSFRVRTANAMVGVKGTEFVVMTNGSSTSVATLSGLVALASIENPALSVNIPKGKISKAVKGGAPTKPILLTPKAKKALISDKKTLKKAKIKAKETQRKPKTKPVPKEKQKSGSKSKAPGPETKAVPASETKSTGQVAAAEPDPAMAPIAVESESQEIDIGGSLEAVSEVVDTASVAAEDAGATADEIKENSELLIKITIEDKAP